MLGACRTSRPVPATTPASWPAACPRRCCSCATPPASATRRDEHAEPADCLAGVERPRWPTCWSTWPVTTEFWCERAWLPGGVADVGVLVRAADGVLTSVDAGCPGAGDDRLPGMVLPGLRQRPLARLPPCAARPHPRRRRHVLDLARGMYALAARLDPDSYHRLARLVFAEMARRRLSPASASSTTCTTRPAAPAMPTRTRWARPWSRPPAKPASASRCWTPCIWRAAWSVRLPAAGRPAAPVR